MHSPTTKPPSRRGSRRVVRALGLFLAVVVLLLLVAGIGLRWHLGRSLPALDGEIRVTGLTAAVTIERDGLGVPTIHGANRLDVARGLGFAHAQDRFFQMDLIRRKSAGELAELVGAGALPLDRQVRIHRFRARASDVVAALDDAELGLLDAYVDGVNAGLSALTAPPFEYLVLGAEPAPWRREDTILAVYAMYLDLQGRDARRESAYGLAHDLLPPALYAFLTPRGTEWDAPIDGEPFVAPPIPTAEELDQALQPAATKDVAELGIIPPSPPFSKGGSGIGSSADDGDFEFAIGSNNWAVAGSHTAGSGAMLANDMHLSHAVPNIWYRASLVFPDPDQPGVDRKVTGVTLPGGMMVVVGSNGEVAWGFTNSQGDWTDLVLLEIDPDDPDVYQTPEGPQRFERHQEILKTKDGAEEILEVVETIWGPVWDTDHQGRQRALSWVAHHPRAANLGLVGLETVSTIDEAMAAAHRSGNPAQNFVTADADGRVGWTIMGPIPRRVGHDGRLPTSWADGSRGWNGWLWPEEVPKVVDPPSGRIWTANARVVSDAMYARLGDGGYDLGARAGQIRDRLFAAEQFTEADLLAIQLDDRALFLKRWHGLLLEVLTTEAIAVDPRRAELRRLLEDWNGRASPDSVAYRLVRGFRLKLRDQVFESLTAPCKAADENFSYQSLGQKEGPLWRLANERPAHLLNPELSDWQEQLLAAVDAILDDLTADGGELATKTWGDRNRVAMQHPLSRFMPFAARWLDMPTRSLPGDSDMPRVQHPGAGASERMVVTPGREDQGVFHMPTGQSGHPLSPNYGDGHDAWADGEPTPFLPGPRVHTLTLVPTDADSDNAGNSETEATAPDDTVEALSLLGQPLERPDLPEDYRSEQHLQLTSALADLEERPNDPEAVIWVGRRTAYLGRYREALEVYSRGIAAHPEHAALYRHRGHRYITVRRLDDAVADLTRASELIATTPDRVEADGLPNARNIPTSTSHSNIWYHLGLVHYLKGDFENAHIAFERCMRFSTNPDMLAATSHWLIMTLRRLGQLRKANILLIPIQPQMDIIENHSYHRLLLMYKGLEDPERLLAEAETAGGVDFASIGYGIGNWYLTEGDRQRAKEVFERVVATDVWSAFGFIAAEAELARWDQATSADTPSSGAAPATESEAAPATESEAAPATESGTSPSAGLTAVWPGRVRDGRTLSARSFSPTRRQTSSN